MFVRISLGLLAVCCLIAASDPSCEELVVPLDDRNLISGKWIIQVGTSDNEDLMNEYKTFKSSWMEVAPVPNSNNLIMKGADKTNDGKCIYSNSTLMYSSSTDVEFTNIMYGEKHKGKFLKTCTDCLLWVDNTLAGTPELVRDTNIFLFTRSGNLDDAHLETFKKQVACLNLKNELLGGDSTDLCPEEGQP